MGVDQTLIEGLTQALEKQRQIDVSSQMNRFIQNGVNDLNEAIQSGLDIQSLRNKYGMTLLHVAAASSNEHASSIVQYIVDHQLLNVNEKSRVHL